MKELNDMQDELTQLRQHASKSQELTQHNQSQLKVRDILVYTCQYSPRCDSRWSKSSDKRLSA